MSYSDIKPQSLERSALEKRRLLTAVNKFRFTQVLHLSINLLQ